MAMGARGIRTVPVVDQRSATKGMPSDVDRPVARVGDCRRCRARV
ncbi:MAG TPA: hypothetical protein VMG09_17055 [Bacteroidota bacterium]|nr:hypothetical protein [Bacteroidota bacterium]